ncbi:MAG: hypothetical protein ABL912_08050 [Novosphingobium sp.]
MNSLRGKSAQDSFCAESEAVLWPDLFARFTAAHALAGELARGSRADRISAGGFANWKSAQPAGGNTSRAVNRTPLADGKSAGCIAYGIASQPMDGGRGK